MNNETKTTGGVKYDEHKPPVHLLPFDALFAITEILKFGAEKYTREYDDPITGFIDIVKPDKMSIRCMYGFEYQLSGDKTHFIDMCNGSRIDFRTFVNDLYQTIVVDGFTYSGQKTTVQNLLENFLSNNIERLNLPKGTTCMHITGSRNWERGMPWHKPFRACLSHLWKWFMKTDDGKGPGMDEETGKSHLLHAGACILFLISYEIRNTGEDTRP